MTRVYRIIHRGPYDAADQKDREAIITTENNATAAYFAFRRRYPGHDIVRQHGLIVEVVGKK